MRQEAACLLVAEDDVELSLNLLAAVTREATISKHLQRVTSRMLPSQPPHHAHHLGKFAPERMLFPHLPTELLHPPPHGSI